MGMYATKSTAEDSYSIDTKWLKDHDYFCGYKSGGITWTSGFGHESSISFIVHVSFESPNIRFQYSTGSYGEEKKYMDYKFPLVRVPCNLGGFRWAFQCALYKGGRYCGRTVYTLYQSGSGYFGCRHCMNIVYESQRKSGSRFESFGNALLASKKADELWHQIHKWTYRGKLTKKAKKYQQLVLRMPSLTQMAFIESELLLKK